jgi:phage portal protein BeeE
VRIVKEGTREVAYLPAPTGPGAMLRLLERPNRYYSGPLLWMATIVDFIRGDAYWLKERVPNTPGNPMSGRVVRLWWLPRWMVEPAWPEDDPKVFISHYRYTVDGIAYRIEERDIVHFRNGMSPANMRKGVDRLAPLFREIFTDEEAANFTASVLRNLGVPGVVIAPANTTGGSVGRSDPEAVKQKFKDTFGADRRGEPLVLTAPTDVKVLSWSPQEMDLKSLRRIPEERISANLGVPAGVAQLGAGLDRNTFTNYGEANGAAYTQGVIPLQRLIAAELEVQLLSEFADLEREALDVWFDYTAVAAMQAAAAALWKQLESAATKGLVMRSDFKRGVGLPVEPTDDVYVVPNNFLFVPGGGVPPPTGARPAAFGGMLESMTRAQLDGEEPWRLLETTAPAAPADPDAEVRCSSGHLLARGAVTSGALSIKCHSCREVVAVAAA